MVYIEGDSKPDQIRWACDLAVLAPYRASHFQLRLSRRSCVIAERTHALSASMDDKKGGCTRGGGGVDNRGSCSILWEGRHTYTHFHTVPRLHSFVPIAPNFLLALCLLEDEAHWESPNSKATRRVLEGIRVQSADLGPVAIGRKRSKGVFIEELGA